MNPYNYSGNVPNSAAPASAVGARNPYLQPTAAGVNPYASANSAAAGTASPYVSRAAAQPPTATAVVNPYTQQQQTANPYASTKPAVNTAGGYNTPVGSGGYTPPPVAGGYNTPPPVAAAGGAGGYNAPYNNTGYSAAPPSTSAGGYAPPSGGFNASPPSTSSSYNAAPPSSLPPSFNASGGTYGYAAAAVPPSTSSWPPASGSAPSLPPPSSTSSWPVAAAAASPPPAVPPSASYGYGYPAKVPSAAPPSLPPAAGSGTYASSPPDRAPAPVASDYAARLAHMEADMQRSKEQAERQRLLEEEQKRRLQMAEQDARKRAEEQERLRMIAEEKLRVEQETKMRALEQEYQKKLALQMQEAEKRLQEQQRMDAARKQEELQQMYQKLAAEKAQAEAQARQALEQEKAALARLQQQEAEKQRLEIERLQQQQKFAEEQRRKDEQQRAIEANMQKLAAEKAQAEASARALQEQQAHQKASRGWEISPADVKFEKKIGEGAFGEVWVARLYGKTVCAKKIKAQVLSPDMQRSFESEMEVMSRLRHPNILLFMGACVQPGNLMIVMDYLPRGALSKLLHNPAENLPFDLRMRMSRDIAAGMAWLHAQKPPIVHRDLKPENCLVGQNWNVCIGDFGIAEIKVLTQGEPSSTGQGFGSPYYMAPELLLNKQWDRSIDVYAFGITVWEIISRQTPFADLQSFEELVDAVCVGGERPPLPNTIPLVLRQLLEACWSANPQHRPDFTKILDLHTFDAAMIVHLCPDQGAATFWSNCFMNHSPNDVVPFNEFMLAFGGYFQLNPIPPPEDIGVQCLRALVASDDGASVPLALFGRSTQYFPPFTPQALPKMVNTLSAGWFHGPITKHEAEVALSRNKKVGSYLIRYADPVADGALPPGSHLIVSVLGEGGHSHTPVLVDASGFTVSGQKFDSLDQLLLKNKKQLGLTIPCLGSKYDAIKFPDEQ